MSKDTEAGGGTTTGHELAPERLAYIQTRLPAPLPFDAPSYLVKKTPTPQLSASLRRGATPAQSECRALATSCLHSWSGPPTGAALHSVTGTVGNCAQPSLPNPPAPTRQRLPARLPASRLSSSEERLPTVRSPHPCHRNPSRQPAAS